MIPKEEIMGIFEKYNKDEVTIVTVGSHTSLHILKGAKLEGFSTAVIRITSYNVCYTKLLRIPSFKLYSNILEISGIPTLNAAFALGHTTTGMLFSFNRDRSSELECVA